MKRALLFLLTVAASLASPRTSLAASIEADLRVIAGLPGEPRIVSAAGITRNDTPLPTLENPSAFDPTSLKLRLVIVGGLDGDERGARTALDYVRWLKQTAPKALRERWMVSVLPMADPDGRAHARPFVFPPAKGFYDDAEQPESRYVWRWLAYQAPDLVVDIRAAPAGEGADSLSAALRGDHAAGLGPTPAVVLPVSASHDDLASALSRVTTRSAMHAAIAARIARSPIDLARLLAARYPAAPSISYIPALSWINTLKLAATTNDESLRAKVLAQIQPWLSGEKPLLGDRLQLTTVAGTMVFAELAKVDVANAAARKLALEGADAALKEKDDGTALYGQGWTDDMFMGSAILARTAAMDGRAHDLDRAAQRLIAYAGRLQQPDGIFNHAVDGPAAWGRGNGFAAFGLMEVLTAMDAARLGPAAAGPAKAQSATADHPSRAALLGIFAKQMKGLAGWQAPDGTWREIIDRPGAYREETATAMILTAMARGVRLGWIDRSYAAIVDRAWRALAAHVTEDGGLVDVCSGTGAGPTLRYYYDRPAIEGADDRGGAMALVAAMERVAR
jgi:unsaturated rhamnogalacturonyl hydrolase